MSNSLWLMEQTQNTTEQCPQFQNITNISYTIYTRLQKRSENYEFRNIKKKTKAHTFCRRVTQKILDKNSIGILDILLVSDTFLQPDCI